MFPSMYEITKLFYLGKLADVDKMDENEKFKTENENENVPFISAR